MAKKINIENSFNTDNKSVYNYMAQPGLGLYIPLYQRDYSWDKDNIEQLLEDISKGIYRISQNEDEKEIRFLGTIITVKESDRQNIYPKDPQAIPTGIEKIIDGQQRLSTIAILACILTKHLHAIQKKAVKCKEIYNDVFEIYRFWTQRLADLYCFDLLRGTPPLKPRIIRGNVDGWTLSSDINTSYPSPVANYIAETINSYLSKENNYPKPDRNKHGKILYQNIQRIELWLKDSVLRAHIIQNEEFATAEKIIESFSQDTIWQYPRETLIQELSKKDYENEKNPSYFISELIQIVAICHYLLDRCCFTIIQPTDDDWAFDMFQSLNATGTPLTALETFKPTVVNDTNQNIEKFKDSENDGYFSEIENLFSNSMSAKDKSKLTNDFLTSFFVSYNGESLSSHFSHQRKTLINSYLERTDFTAKSAFIKFMGQYARFYKSIWVTNREEIITEIDGHDDTDLAILLLQFLKESNHKMAITILGTFYRLILNGNKNAKDNFIQAVKSVSAFYILWRSCFPNTGLDSVYRDFFKNDEKSWKYEKGITVEQLKEYLIARLSEKGIKDKESWKKYAQVRLNYYDAGSHICRVILLMAFHDTEEDPNKIGLMKYARPGFSPYLTSSKWNLSELKTIEHIAPQNNDDGCWDEEIYDPNQSLFNSIGNLTLLPQQINSSAGNKSYEEKALYYGCISESSMEKIREIGQTAKQLGIDLNPNTINLLRSCAYSSHMSPIVKCYQEGINWNKNFIMQRTDNILNLSWNIISNWIY